MLRSLHVRALLCLILTGATTSIFAQTAVSASAPATSAVPRFVNYPGKVVDSSGKPVAGIATVTFAIYKDEEGGDALWTETQNVRADAEGAYMAQLGITEQSGLPLNLFSAGEPRWVGISVNGAPEKPRALLLSVPYALKAADAETVGGLPASAFMLARAGAVSTTPAATTSETVKPAPKVITNPAITGLGTVGFIPRWDTTSDIVNSALFQSGTSIGIGTTTPAATLDVNGKTDIRDALVLYPHSTDAPLSLSGTNLKMDYTGKITFVTGQTFPGAGTITGITTPVASGIQGGETSGTLALSIRTAGVTNTMLAHSAVQVPVTAPLSGGGAATLGTAAVAISLKPCPAGQLYISNGATWSCTAANGTGKVTSVGLSAPASDFVVSGSPVTTAGTLALNWNVAPTPSNVANSLVKRDASGGFSAGFISASPASGTAVWATSPNGVGVYGESDGSQAGGNGVQGNSYATGGSGVAGFARTGNGVYGSGSTGVYGTGTVGFATDSNVQQARSAGGWVKAMVYVNAETAPYAITRCFNSTLTGAAATTAPCGITLNEVQPGDFQLNFNFQVNDRFFATTIGNASDATVIQVYTTGTDQLEVFTFDNDTNYKGAQYSLIVY